MISTSINSTLKNFDNEKTKFNLIIRFNGESYEGKIVSIRNLDSKSTMPDTKELYDIAFTQNEIMTPNFNAHVKVMSTSFKLDKDEIIQNNKRRLIAKDSKVSQRSSSGGYLVCFDYYLDTYTYDSDGALINYSSSYLGTQCEVRETMAIWWLDNGDGSYSGGGVVEEVDSRYTAELQAFEIGYKSRMSARELAIYNNMTFMQRVSYLANAQEAETYVEFHYSESSLDGGLGDAFRHAYFSLLNMHYLNEALATSLGNAHEDNDMENGVYTMKGTMDLYNNAVGRGSYVPVPLFMGVFMNYIDQVKELLKNGHLRYIKHGVLTPTNQ